MTVFVDTSAWIALGDRRDQWHEAAKQAAKELHAKGERWLTGWHNVYELADGLAGRHGQAVAAERVAVLRATPRLRIEASEPHIDLALGLLRSRPAWSVGLSDCLSFAIMREAGIRRAFTFDQDFRKAGFETVPHSA